MILVLVLGSVRGQRDENLTGFFVYYEISVRRSNYNYFVKRSQD